MSRLSYCLALNNDTSFSKTNELKENNPAEEIGAHVDPDLPDYQREKGWKTKVLILLKLVRSKTLKRRGKYSKIIISVAFLCLFGLILSLIICTVSSPNCNNADEIQAKDIIKYFKNPKVYFI